MGTVGEIRFPSAFTAALCAHAAIALALVLFEGRPRGAREIAPAPIDELVFVNEEPVPATPAPPAPAPEPAPVVTHAGSVAPRRASAARAIADEPAVDPATATQEATTPPPANSSEWSLNARPPVDLGIGGYWKSVASAGPPPASGSAVEPPADGERMNRVLRGALDARDHELGLDHSGPLVSAAREAASLAGAPETGIATIEVDADATGRVTAANVVSANGDAAGWSAVARELVGLLAAKRLQLPHGARGLRAHVRIVAERTLPSGTQTARSPGAVPDDVPGQDPQCVGEGAQRKCNAGMPVGVTQSLGDLANLGAKVIRIVHARILGEVTL